MYWAAAPGCFSGTETSRNAARLPKGAETPYTGFLGTGWGSGIPRREIRSKALARASANSACSRAAAMAAARLPRSPRGFKMSPEVFGTGFRPCASLQVIRYSAISPMVQPIRPPRLRAGGRFPRSMRERTALGVLDKTTAISSTSRKSLSGKRLLRSAKYEAKFIGKSGVPDTIRTCDFHLRRVALYPAELRALGNWQGYRKPLLQGNLKLSGCLEQSKLGANFSHIIPTSMVGKARNSGD